MKFLRLIRDWILLLSRPESAGDETRAGVRPAQTLHEIGLDPAVVERLAIHQGWRDSSGARVLEKLGFDLGTEPDARRGLWFHSLRVLVAGTVFLASTLCVVGAIWEGHSAHFAGRRVTALIVLAILLVVLGVFEGLQICVALLRFKDIENFDRRYPRAARLHKWFRTESGTRRFLAGRQFFVIFVVFFIARITSFPGLRHVPLLGTPLPESFELVWFALFDLGLAGAFLVLWVAQLAPQFGANRDPLAFLELPGMGSSLRACFVVDDTGITLPGFWFSSWVPERRRIPNSRSERYRLAREEGIGAAANLVRYRIAVDGGRARFRVEKRFQLTKGGFEAFDDESWVIESADIDALSYDFVLMRSGHQVVSTSGVTTHRLDERNQLSFRLSPKVGRFEAGDQVVLTANVACPDPGEQSLAFAEPSRLVHVVVDFGLAPRSSAVPEAWVQRFDSHLPERGPRASLPVSVEGGVAFAEYFCVFPRPGEVLRFTWRRDRTDEGSRSAQEGGTFPRQSSSVQEAGTFPVHDVLVQEAGTLPRGSFPRGTVAGGVVQEGGTCPGDGAR